MSTLTGIASGATLPGASPYLNQIAQALSALTGVQTERNVSDIEARYGARGNAMSSEAARAVGEARTTSGANLANTLGLSAYETGVGQATSAAQTGLQYERDLAQLLFGTGAAEQQVSQQGIQNALAELARVETSPYTALSALGSTRCRPAVRGLPGMSAVTP